MFAMRDPSPNAIILDVNMPGGTGLETLRKLRMSAKTMHIPVLVVTGGTDPNVAETAAEIGADDFLRKPIEPDALREAMVKLVPPPPAKR
jgi:DNA-binding response OmpR family regulator